MTLATACLSNVAYLHNKASFYERGVLNSLEIKLHISLRKLREEFFHCINLIFFVRWLIRYSNFD